MGTFEFISISFMLPLDKCNSDIFMVFLNGGLCVHVVMFSVASRYIVMSYDATRFNTVRLRRPRA